MGIIDSACSRPGHIKLECYQTVGLLSAFGAQNGTRRSNGSEQFATTVAPA